MLPAPITPDLYTGPGFQFRYPAGWSIEEERTEEQFTVSALPDGDEGSTYWSVTLLHNRPSPLTAVRAALRALEQEYEEIDSYVVEERISGRKAAGRDVEFICFELTNTAGIRAFRTRDFTALVMFQVTDSDLNRVQPAFRMMTGSLQCGSDGAGEFAK